MEQRYGYTGREHDPETGLIYYRARHYDPATGQFIQRDPIGFAAGDLNLYAYVWNDPYNWTDPSGLTAIAETPANHAGQAGIRNAALPSIARGIASLAANIRKALNAFKVANVVANSANQESSSDSSDKSSDDDGSDCNPTDPSCDPEEEGSDKWRGDNGNKQGDRYNTDLPGGKDAAEELFGELAEGEVTELSPDHLVAENGVRIRFTKSGPRVDIPSSVSGNSFHETVHF
ncbi:MAG: RHS repeat-associated core domain-containing protein [Pseudomonadota bacterium]